MIGAAELRRRDPRDWVDDMIWHRRMFAESHFRWAPEDPYAIALTWTRGRLAYETVREFRLLDQQILQLNIYAAQIDDAMAPLLAEARARCTDEEWGRGLQLVGLTATDAEVLRYGAQPLPAPHPEVRRALRGIPLPNPLSQIWELRQMREMYRAAEHVLEDTLCDLALELVSDGVTWPTLALQTQRHGSERTLQLRVDDQRAMRGAPGDPRRHPGQTFTKAGAGT